MRKVHPLIKCLFVLPIVLWFGLAVILPSINSIIYGFFDWNGIGQKIFIGFDNYVEIFKDPIAIKAITNSLVLTFWSVLFQLPIGMFFAVILYNKIKGKGFFRTAFFLPVILSSSLVGILWGQIYDPNFGLVNLVLQKIGLGHLQKAWLGDVNLALGAVVVVIIWQYIGNYILIYYSALHSISEDVLEYASLEKMNSVQLFFKIQLPLIWPTISLTIILATVNSLRYFDLIYVMTNGGPNHSSEVLATYVVKSAFNSMRYGYASAVAVVLLILGIFFLAVLNSVLKREKIEY